MDEWKIRDLATLVLETFNRRARIVPSPAPLGETDRRCPDIKRIQALGYTPKIDLREGVARMAQWYLAHRDLWPAEVRLPQ